MPADAILSRRGPRVFRRCEFTGPGTAICGITAWSLSGPAPAEYLLGAMPAAAETTLQQTGLAVVEVKRIRLPDYLDTTDILERRGNQLVSSLTGRWSERLSVGMARALIASLASRLPHLVVTATPVGRPAMQILLDVAAFEARPDHQVDFVARWAILDGSTAKCAARNRRPWWKLSRARAMTRWSRRCRGLSTTWPGGSPPASNVVYGRASENSVTRIAASFH